MDFMHRRDLGLQRIAMLGLDDAGKSTLLYQMKLQDTSNVVPTIGFNVEEITIPHARITFLVWDVGGQQRLRAMWKHYLRDVTGVIFVVDSVATERFPEAYAELRQLFLDPHLLDVPVVVMANKQDTTGAVLPCVLESQLHLDVLLAGRKDWRVMPTVATTGFGVEDAFMELSSLVRLSFRRSGSGSGNSNSSASSKTSEPWRTRITNMLMSRRNSGNYLQA